MRGITPVSKHPAQIREYIKHRNTQPLPPVPTASTVVCPSLERAAPTDPPHLLSPHCRQTGLLFSRALAVLHPSSLPILGPTCFAFSLPAAPRAESWHDLMTGDDQPGEQPSFGADVNPSAFQDLPPGCSVSPHQHPSCRQTLDLSAYAAPPSGFFLRNTRPPRPTRRLQPSEGVAAATISCSSLETLSRWLTTKRYILQHSLRASLLPSLHDDLDLSLYSYPCPNHLCGHSSNF